jgi:hypothetical protein
MQQQFVPRPTQPAECSSYARSMRVIFSSQPATRGWRFLLVRIPPRVEPVTPREDGCMDGIGDVSGNVWRAIFPACLAQCAETRPSCQGSICYMHLLMSCFTAKQRRNLSSSFACMCISSRSLGLASKRMVFGFTVDTHGGGA